MFEKSTKSRQAFTLVELLVVITIIGLLIGMLLPAVQAVRAAARRAKCANNIRQLSLAVHSYESAHSVFPVNQIGPGPLLNGGTTAGTGYYSWLVWILPFIEQQNLYHSMDLSVNMSSFTSAGGLHSPMSVQISADHPNAIAAATRVATFLCPADNIDHQNAAVLGTANPASGSYAANMGWPPSVTGYNGERTVPGNFNGVIPIHHPAPPEALAPHLHWHPSARRSFRDLLDGTSHTCMISERLVQSGQTIQEISNSDPRMLSHHVGRAAITLAQLAELCGPPVHTDAPYSGFLGRAWVLGWAPAGNMYVHLKTPNTNNGHFTGATQSSERQGDLIVTPSSQHSGGVNVAFADGSTHFISDAVDPATWWALGSADYGDIPGSH